MKEPTCTKVESFYIEEELFVSDHTDHIDKILDSKYQPSNLEEIFGKTRQLNYNQKNQLLEWLKIILGLFNDTLGQWKVAPYKVEIQDGAKPYHARFYIIPNAYEHMFRLEVERLC